MSDVIVIIYLVVASGLITALLFHKGVGHRRIFSSLFVWTLSGIFVSTIGGLLIHGTFTPNTASYNSTYEELYNMFTWGGIEIPQYDVTLVTIRNLGIVTNAMGLGILVMTMLAGFFPRSFFLSAGGRKEKEAH